MENIIRLCNNHTLFVGGVSTREEAAEVLAKSVDHTPIGLMFKNEYDPIRAYMGPFGKYRSLPRIISIKVGKSEILNIPFRHIRLEDRAVVTQTMALAHEGQMIEGLGIGLPDDAVRLHCAYEQARKGLTYNWDDFLKSYRQDLEKIGSLFFDHIDTARIDGMQAQVITHWAIEETEVGLGMKTMKKLHGALVRTHAELEDMDTLDGMWVLLQRYPVIDKQRWVQLRLVPGGTEGKLLVNAKIWKEIYEGDEDGDEGYIGISRVALFI